MPADAFLDTNILIYAIEMGGRDRQKAESARRLLRGSRFVLSTQVLGEFYRAVTSARRGSPLTHEEAVSWIQLWKRHDVQSITGAHVDLALECARQFQISYYDALILSAARFANCKLVYSEDLSAEQDYGGVRVVNPFAA